jgi:hypothetical protein
MKADLLRKPVKLDPLRARKRAQDALDIAGMIAIDFPDQLVTRLR